jgi:hypothetical protein
MGINVADELLDLPGVPAGLTARRLPEYREGADGQRVERTHRRGLRKLDRVELVSSGPVVPLELDASEEAWVLNARQRRWRTVQARYGNEAARRAAQLVRAGVVRLICPVDSRMHVGAPASWVLTDEWERRASERSSKRNNERERWLGLANAAAKEVEVTCPPLAEALRRASPTGRTTAMLVHAARDLASGVVHDGPRAFSQTHFSDTKTHDDVPDVLRRAGVDEEVISALGLRRSARLGVAGPIQAEVGDEFIRLSLLDGPVLLRADQPGLSLRLAAPVPLVVVENLQAADVLANQLPDLAVIYTAGPPGDAALGLIASVGSTASRQLVVPDGDLGGVRIADRVLSVLPEASVVDIGAQPHPAATPWPAEGVSIAGLRAAEKGRVRELAQACLARGYPVEQELATVRAVTEALR